MAALIPIEQTLRAKIADLRARLDESEETLRAIRSGDVDALVVEGAAGPQIFTLEGAEAESNRLRSNILGKISDAVLAADENEHVIFFNAAAERQYGLTASEALGRKLDELFVIHWLHPGEADQMETALHAKGWWRGENIHRRRDGTELHVESSVSRLLDKDGSAYGRLSVIRDITGRRRAEDALRVSEESFRTLANAIPQLAWMADADGFIHWYNERWYEYTGTTAKQMEGWGWQSVHDPKYLPAVIARWKESLSSGEPFEMVFPLRNAAGEFRPFLTLVLPMRNGDGRVVQWFGTNTDVNELKRAEETLRKNEEALRKSEQALEEQADALRAADRSKDEFLAMLAHELRNPLAPLRNAAEILRVENTSVDERAQAQRILGRQIENMSRMLDDLLDVSRITEGKITLRTRPVSIEGILTSAVSLVRSACAARGQELTVRLPKEPVFLEADNTRLEQVFGNLLGNACKYGGDGCHIALTAERIGREAVVRVRDDGAGIAPELLPRIFDLFVQASRTLDRSHGGLGIGLTLVQRLVRLHGGTIQAKSEGVGKGAEFIVRLPVLEEVPKSAPLPLEPAIPDQARRILIVDDNTDAARSLATLQKRRGHDTRTVFTGPDAVAAAAEFLPEVVFLDIGLPGMDGFEVARAIRAMPAGASAFLIAMSGYGRDDDRREAELAGFDEYLVKPVDLGVLRALLQRGAGTRRRTAGSRFPETSSGA